MKKILAFICSFIFLSTILSACTQEKNVTGTESAILAEGMSAADYLDLGIKYLSEGNYEEAIIAFTAAIDIDPNNTDAYLGRARTYVAEAKASAPEGIEIVDWPEELIALYKQAENDYLKAISIDQQLVDAYLELTDLYMEQGEIEKALNLLQEGFGATGDISLQARQQELFQSEPLEGYPKMERQDNSDGSYCILEYNEWGQLVLETWYTAEEALNFTTAYTYTDAGYLLKEVREYSIYNENSPQKEEFDYSGTQRQDMIHLYQVWFSGFTQEFSYTYSGTSASIQVRIVDDNYSWSPMEVTIPYTMQDSSHFVQQTGTAWSDEGFEDLWVTEYDAEYNPITEVRLAPDGSFIE